MADTEVALPLRQLLLAVKALATVGVVAVLSAAASPADSASPSVCIRSAGLSVDADGAPNSYRVDGKGLSHTCDGVFAVVHGVAHTQKNDKQNWQALCLQHWTAARTSGDYSGVKIVGFARDAQGRPILQGAGDPLPRVAFITTTTLHVPGTSKTAQDHYVDAKKLPYVVMSPARARQYGLKLGGLVIVFLPKTKSFAYAVFGDCCTIGEGSIKLHQALGLKPYSRDRAGVQRANHGLKDTVWFFPVPGSPPAASADYQIWSDHIKSAGDAAMHSFGDTGGLQACIASASPGNPSRAE